MLELVPETRPCAGWVGFVGCFFGLGLGFWGPLVVGWLCPLSLGCCSPLVW